VRYEDLVADPAGGLERLTAALGAPPRRPPAVVIEGTTMSRMRDRVGSDHHFWQGRPGLWKLLLTAPVAEEIAGAHSAYCEQFGYACDPDPELTPAQADANWVACLGSQVAAKLQQQRVRNMAFNELKARCAHLELVNGQLQAGLDALKLRLEAVQEELAHYRRLGGWVPAPVTRSLHGLAQRFPGAAAAFKRVLRRPAA